VRYGIVAQVMKRKQKANFYVIFAIKVYVIKIILHLGCNPSETFESF